jgi:hypothetical protein
MDYHVYTGVTYKKGEFHPTILETGKSYSYGDFEPYGGEVTDENKKNLFLLPEIFEGSDYAGGLCQLSNHKTFMERFKKTEGVYDLHGGFGTYAIAIRADVAESNEEIKEVLSALENYPVMDEDVFREIESEWEIEAMKDIVDDLCRAVHLEELLPNQEELLEDKEAIEQYAWDGIAWLNLEFSHENSSAWLDFKRVQPYVEDRLLIDHCPKPALLISREWSCEEVLTRYEKKLKGE